MGLRYAFAVHIVCLFYDTSLLSYSLANKQFLKALNSNPGDPTLVLLPPPTCIPHQNSRIIHKRPDEFIKRTAFKLGQIRIIPF